MNGDIPGSLVACEKLDFLKALRQVLRRCFELRLVEVPDPGLATWLGVCGQCSHLSDPVRLSSNIIDHSPMVLQHTFCIFLLRSLRATALLISGSTEISSVCAGLVSCTKLRALKCGTEPA